MVTLTIISRKTHQFHVCALVVAGEPLGLIWGFSPSFHSLFSEGNAHLLSSGKKIHVFLKKPLQYFSEAKPLEKLSCIFFFLFQFLITLPLCPLRNAILQKIFARFSGGKAADHRVITSNYSRIGTKHCTNIVTFKQLTWGPETQLEFRQLALGKKKVIATFYSWTCSGMPIFLKLRRFHFCTCQETLWSLYVLAACSLLYN